MVGMFGVPIYGMVGGSSTAGVGEGCKTAPPPNPVSPAHKAGRRFSVPELHSGKSVH